MTIVPRIAAAVVSVVLLGGSFLAYRAAQPVAVDETATGPSTSSSAVPSPSPSAGPSATGGSVAGSPSGSGRETSASPTPKSSSPARPKATKATKASSTASAPATTTATTPKSVVRAAEATRLEIPGVLSAAAGGAVSPDPGTNELVPPTAGRVYRWADRGIPGTTTKDTVFLLGHTVRAGGGVFDRLQAVAPGQRIQVVTANGTLTYIVQNTRLYLKNRIQHADEVYASVPGRLVLVGCYLNPDGSRQDRNFVVFAQLAR